MFDMQAEIRAAGNALTKVLVEAERRGIAGLPGYPFADSLEEVIASLWAWADKAE